MLVWQIIFHVAVVLIHRIIFDNSKRDLISLFDCIIFCSHACVSALDLLRLNLHLDSCIPPWLGCLNWRSRDWFLPCCSTAHSLFVSSQPINFVRVLQHGLIDSATARIRVWSLSSDLHLLTKASQTSFGIPKFLEQSGINTQLSRDSVFLQHFKPLNFWDTSINALLLHCLGAWVFIIALWNWSPGQSSDSQHRLCAPSRISHHTMNCANTYSLSARQCYHMLSCSGVDANPCSFDAPFC